MIIGELPARKFCAVSYVLPTTALNMKLYRHGSSNSDHGGHESLEWRTPTSKQHLKIESFSKRLQTKRKRISRQPFRGIDDWVHLVCASSSRRGPSNTGVVSSIEAYTTVRYGL